MGRTNDKPIKDAIEQMLKVYKLKRKFDETSLVVAWPEMMGMAIANRTKDIFIRDRKLFVRIESAVIKNELVMMRSNIIDKMNERAGSSVIDEIIFLWLPVSTFGIIFHHQVVQNRQKESYRESFQKKQVVNISVKTRQVWYTRRHYQHYQEENKVTALKDFH